LATASSPGLAADLDSRAETGARRSGAFVGGYFRLPLDSPAAADRAPRAGLRLAMRHDYRSASAPTARLTDVDGIELRLAGSGNPSLYLAGRAVTGAEAKLEASEGGGGRLDAIMLGGAILLAGVAGFVVVQSLD
jgi:hypothetical protein